MDAKERELERHAVRGDIEAALNLEKSRTRSGRLRAVDRNFPEYEIEINQRYIRGPLVITPRSNKRFSINSTEEAPLFVNGIPYEVRFTFYFYTEEDDLRISLYPSDDDNFILGWYPAEPETIANSQEAERRHHWALYAFLSNGYESGGPHATMYRVTGGFPMFLPPTPKALQRLTAFLTELMARWSEEHLHEVAHAHGMFLNNKIIEQKADYDQLLIELSQKQNQLGNLIIEELGYR